MYCDNQVPAGIIADKKGCNTMVSFTESGNIENITFDQAWKAAGFSSNMDDYFDVEVAKFVGMK